MAKIDGATLLVRNLKRQGVEYMFGVVGFLFNRLRSLRNRKASPISVCAMSRRPRTQLKPRVIGLDDQGRV